MTTEYQDQVDPFQDVIGAIDGTGESHKLLQTLIDSQGVEGKTDLNPKQIKAFTVLDLYHQRYPEYGFDRLKIFLWLQISKGGNSRKQMAETLKGRVSFGNDNLMIPQNDRKLG